MIISIEFCISDFPLFLSSVKYEVQLLFVHER